MSFGTGGRRPAHGDPGSADERERLQLRPDADVAEFVPAVEPPAATQQPAPVSVFNVANALTVARLALVPVFLVALFEDGGHQLGWRLAATLVFTVAAVTDRFDGDLARRRGLVTDFGKLADPIADKALIGSALVGLSILGELSWWVTVVIAVREVAVTLLRFWVVSHEVIPASWGGKAKALLQVVAILAYLLPLPGAFGLLRWALMDLAVLLTLLTGLDYAVRVLRLRARARQARGAS